MSRFNPHYPHAREVFAAADEFKKKCLLGNGSLFLPDARIWTPDHFAVLTREFVQQPDNSKRGFWAKLEGQLAICQPLDIALMAEIFWIVQLPPSNLKPQTKVSALQRIWKMSRGAPGVLPSDSPFLTNPVLSGLGSAGPGYTNYLPNELTFAVTAFAEFCAKPHEEREQLLADGFAFAEWLDKIPSGNGRQFYHALCHVLFPDSFERIFSRGNKNQVARAHGIWMPEFKDDRTALDAALLKLRTELELKHPGEVDYYAEPVATLIKNQGKHPTKDLPGVAPSETGTTESVAEEPAADYEVPQLRTADNLVLYGPPGTGKTYEMQQRMEAAYDKGEEFEFVAFHPSYSYEDFVGGLRPVPAANGLGIQLRYEKGPFLRICDKAHSEPSQRFTLFIDEINRANVAKVFGELVTLIEPSKRVIAGSKPNDNGAWVRMPASNDLFGVPDNLNIVATMNTADRSVTAVDLALRRRFRFQECPPAPDRIEPPTVGSVDLPRLLACINDRLEFLLGRDYAIGHAFFMGIVSLDALRSALAQRVIPLLEEYFFEDLDKVRLVLTGSTRPSAFFQARSLQPASLFPGAGGTVGSESRASFAVTDPSTWTEEAIQSLYQLATAGVSQAAVAAAG